MARDLKNMSHEQAESNGWQVLKPLDCEVMGKAVYQDGEEKVMKSTKRFPVWLVDINKTNTLLGWIYNTSTEYHKGGQVSIAEALVFVPLESK